jgi:homoserine acetyltransferase
MSWGIKSLIIDEPFVLNNGTILKQLKIGYSDTGGDKPVFLVFHGFSSNSDIPTWWGTFNWEEVVAKYRVVSINCLGSCHGSTGPNDFTLQNLNSEFPKVDIQDTVNFTIRALKEFGINKVQITLGCSLGGMQALDLFIRFPNFSETVISAGAAPLELKSQIYNMVQIGLIDEAILSGQKSIENIALKYARYLFRLSCTTTEALDDLKNKLNCDDEFELNGIHGYYLFDGENYAKAFSIKSFRTLMKMITEFKLPPISNDFPNNSKIYLLALCGDNFIDNNSIKQLNKNFNELKICSQYEEFNTKFGHESWIEDGAKFYEFVNSVACII